MASRKIIPPRAKVLLRWLLEYQRRNGFMPSMREMAKAHGMRSHNGAKYYLGILEEHGYLLRRFNAARAYQVTAAGLRVDRGSGVSARGKE